MNNVITREVKVNAVYRHFKGKYIYVVAIASDSESLKDMVIYRHVGEEKLWVRPVSSFIEEVDINREDNINHQQERFAFVDLNLEEQND